MSPTTMSCFSSFRPSERQILLSHAMHEPAEFQRDLQDYLTLWERADWLDEGAVARIGTWMARQCPKQVRQAAQEWALGRRNACHPANDTQSTWQPEKVHEIFLGALQDEKSPA